MGIFDSIKNAFGTRDEEQAEVTVSPSQMLRDAGVPEGFETAIYYRDVVRDYLPGPGFIAVEIQTQLRENLGIEATVVEMESGAFIEESQAGRLDGFHMLGWTGDYPHITNFMDFHFGAEVTQFGSSHPEISGPVGELKSLTDPAAIAEAASRVNNATLLPGIK